MNYNERRVKSRYPLSLNVRYQTMGTVEPGVGVGQTINISSGGLFMACRKSIPEGTRVKLFVEWPSLLNGTTPLQLITVGTVVRCTPLGFSIMFESYQFRTMSRARPSNVTRMPDRVSPAYESAQPEPITLVAKASS
jgi:hypothetical protein